MNLSELQDLAERNTTIDEKNIGEYSLSLAYVTSKWLTLLSEERILFEALQIELAVKRKQRGYYYRNEYQHTLDNAKHLEELLQGDKDLNKVKVRTVLSLEKINFIEGVIKTLNNSSFNVSNYVKWKQFQNGGI